MRPVGWVGHGDGEPWFCDVPGLHGRCGNPDVRNLPRTSLSVATVPAMTATVTRICRTVRFAAPGGWSVKIISYRAPGNSAVRMQYFVVYRDGTQIKETCKAADVSKLLGDAFPQLVEVAP